ncbi:MAG: hypothetical protein ACOY4K_13230 [Pseudomonadota bacterium]
MRKKSRYSDWRDLMGAYGEILQRPGPSIQPESALPVPKAELRDVMLKALGTDISDRERAGLEAGLLHLTQFQPLTSLEKKAVRAFENPVDDVLASAAAIVSAGEAYQRLNKRIMAEVAEVQAAIEQASRHNQAI